MYVAGIVLTLRLQSFRYSRKRDIWERNVISARCWWTILNFRIQTIRFDFRSNLWDILKLWWKEANIDWRDIFRFEEDGEKNRDSRDCCDRLYFSIRKKIIPILNLFSLSPLFLLWCFVARLWKKFWIRFKN